VGEWENFDFEEVIRDETKFAKKIRKNDYLYQGKNLIIDQGKNYIAGYTNNVEKIYENVPVIIFGDHTRIIKYVDEPFYIGADGVKVLKVKMNEINTKFIFYYLKNCRIEDTGYNRHFKWLKEFKIPVPSIRLQEQIVKVLDKANFLIEKRKLQVEKLDLLIKSQFVEIFGNPIDNAMGWEIVKFNDLGELGRGVSKHRPRNATELLGGIYPLIQTGDVANANPYIKDYRSTYSELGLKQSKMWKKGTLCITIAANIAKTGILGFDACFPDSIVGFVSSDETNNIFIHYWFAFFQEIIEAQAPESAQKNINLEILRKLKIIRPPIELQTQFADFVNKVEKTKATLQQSLTKMEQNYKSLMQKCFRGEIF